MLKVGVARVLKVQAPLLNAEHYPTPMVGSLDSLSAARKAALKSS
jgi:hypothetical protein